MATSHVQPVRNSVVTLTEQKKMAVTILRDVDRDLFVTLGPLGNRATLANIIVCHVTYFSRTR